MDLALAAILVVLQGLGEDPTPEPPEPAPEVVEPAVVEPAVVEPAALEPAAQAPEARAPGTLSDAQIRWINRRWAGVGVGFDNGLWGGKYAQTLKVFIPFGRDLGRFVGLRVRGGMVFHSDEALDQFDPVVNAGVEFVGRSPVWWGVMRVYGGGGAWAGIRPNPTSGPRYRVGGGGFVGLEAFAAPFMSFTFEVGGQSPGHGLGVDAGGSVMGGMMFYFGRTETRWSALR